MANRPHCSSATPNVNRFRQRMSHFRPDMRYLRRCGMPIVMGWFRSRFCLPWMAAPRSARERRLLDVVAKSVLIGRLGTSGKWGVPEVAIRTPSPPRGKPPAEAPGRNSFCRRDRTVYYFLVFSPAVYYLLLILQCSSTSHFGNNGLYNRYLPFRHIALLCRKSQLGTRPITRPCVATIAEQWCPQHSQFHQPSLPGLYVGPHPFQGNNANAVQAIVIGDYLYIDGGEINFYDNGVPTHLPGLSISNTLPDQDRYLRILSI
jgi:hypothetical protein